MFCKTFSMRLKQLILTANCFSLNLKQDLTVGVLLVIYIQGVVGRDHVGTAFPHLHVLL